MVQRFGVWIGAIAFSVEPFFQAMQGALDRRMDLVFLWLLACAFLFTIAVLLEKVKLSEGA